LPDDIAQKLWPSGFRPAAGMCKRGFIRGQIQKGDYEKVRALYGTSFRTMTILYLLSPGGDAEEAMRIGRLLRKYLTSAWAPARFSTGEGYLPGQTFQCRGTECVCASACALIWFGAVDRFGVVGLHRPRIDDPKFKSLPPADAAKMY